MVNGAEEPGAWSCQDVRGWGQVGGALRTPGTMLGADWVAALTLRYLANFLRGSEPLQGGAGHNDQTESQDAFPLCHASLKLSGFRFGGEERPHPCHSLWEQWHRPRTFFFLGNDYSSLAADVWDGSIFTGSLFVVLLFSGVAHVSSNPKLPFSHPPHIYIYIHLSFKQSCCAVEFLMLDGHT